jgi:hypothetical protein
MPYVVYGLARDPAQARTVVDALTALGLTSDQVSILAADERASGSLAQELQAQSAHGAFAGGNIGGSIGWLAGLTTLAIPGLGLFIAAGPILGFLTGIAVGRAVGNLNGAMIEEMGIPDAEVARYKEGLRAGRIVISAHLASDNAELVAMEMRRAGAAEVGTHPV